MSKYSVIEYDEFITRYTGAELVKGNVYNIKLNGKMHFPNAELLDIQEDCLWWQLDYRNTPIVTTYDYLCGTETTIEAA